VRVMRPPTPTCLAGSQAGGVGVSTNPPTNCAIRISSNREQSALSTRGQANTRPQRLIEAGVQIPFCIKSRLRSLAAPAGSRSNCYSVVATCRLLRRCCQGPITTVLRVAEKTNCPPFP
jgi:hypothetical protein